MAPPMREGYDPVAVRARGKGGKKLPPQFRPRGGIGGPAAARKAASSSRPSAARSRAAAPAAATRKPTSNPVKKPPARTVASKENTKAGPSNAARPRDAENNGDADRIVADATLMKKNKELTTRNAELEVTMSELEQERDFYFEKLRGIEVMLQVYEERTEEEKNSEEVISKIFKVLYAAAEDNVVVNDDGELDLVGADGEIIGFDGGDVEEEGEEGLAAAEEEDVYKNKQFDEIDDELEASLLDD